VDSTHATSLGSTTPTGVWLEEVAVPYMMLTKAGYKVDIASPNGGEVPIDPHSKTLYMVPGPLQKLEWNSVLKALTDSISLRSLIEPTDSVEKDRSSGIKNESHDVNVVGSVTGANLGTVTLSTKDVVVDVASRYVALFFPGGHGPMFDLINDAYVQQLIPQFVLQGKWIAAICHGPAALLNCRITESSSIDKSSLLTSSSSSSSSTSTTTSWLVNGVNMTCFSWDEEQYNKMDAITPFNLEAMLVEHGARLSKAEKPMEKHVVVDAKRKLITGENPNSSTELAEKLLESIKCQQSCEQSCQQRCQ